MRVEQHNLSGASLGTQRAVTALHFGPESATRKIYIQASLHANELPGALTAYHLRQKLLELESQEQLHSKIILVPMCNPIGLGQSIHYAHVGRFDLFSGQNFNRLGNLSLFEMTLTQLKADQTVFTSDAVSNVRTIRQAMGKALMQQKGMTQLEHLHLILLGLAHDADVVLDLHCDETAALHMYMLPQLWPTLEPLARFLGSRCQLLAEDTHVNPFDEALSTVWSKLRVAYPDANIPYACASTTVELRSRADVAHEFAVKDANAIVQFLGFRGDVTLTAAQSQTLPDLLATPNPLSGKAYVFAPHSGVVVFHIEAGDEIAEGQIVAEIIDPIQGESVGVFSPIDGFVYARNTIQFAQQGDNLISISGKVDLGHGAGLSA